MKKLFLVAAVAVFALTNVNAQEFKLGAKAGVNLSTLTGSNVDVDSRTSFNVGIVARLGLTDKFSLQPELVYSSQGHDTNGFELKLDYINIPVLADYTIIDGLSVQAGPQFGFVINDKFETSGNSVDANAESFDIGAAVGAQYKLPSIDLFFQARYTLGFLETFDSSDAKNSNFSLSVGYFFL